MTRPFKDLLDPKLPATSSDEAAALYREALLEVCGKALLVMHKAMAAVTDPQLRADAIEADKQFKAHSHENRIYGRNAPLMVNVPLAQARYVLQLADILLKAEYHQDRAANDLRSLLKDHLATQSERGFAAQLSSAMSAVTAQAEKAVPKDLGSVVEPKTVEVAAPQALAVPEIPSEMSPKPKKKAPKPKTVAPQVPPSEASASSLEPLALPMQIGFDETMDEADAKHLSQYIEDGQVYGRYLVGYRSSVKVAGVMLYPTQIEGHKLDALLTEMAELPGISQIVLGTMADEPALGGFLRRSKSLSKELLAKDPFTKKCPLAWFIYPKEEICLYIDYVPQGQKLKETNG